jgi:2-polyprenyl-3-methyl-5-hydroxy-6-metoxy-1,4-benzoquinol methylase
MERHAFELLNAMERSWWYRARARAIRVSLQKASAPRTGDVLDFGAGFGGMFETLSRFGNRVYAFEPDKEADTAARKRGYASVFSNDNEALVSNRYHLIGAFDVVEHIADDHAFLVRAHASLTSGGLIAITVPAFPFLWSIHDVNHHHFRRYTKSTMQLALERAGFTVVNTSYWNASLFIPAALMRLLGRSGESSLGLPRIIDNLFFFVLSVEMLIMRVMSLPFGTGLVVVAQKINRPVE